MAKDKKKSSDKKKFEAELQKFQQREEHYKIVIDSLQVDIVRYKSDLRQYREAEEARLAKPWYRRALELFGL